MILVGIGILIGVVVCRKRTGSPIRVGSPDDFTTPTYVSAQRVEPRVRYGTVDRRRSQRTSLYIEESRNGGLTAIKERNSVYLRVSQKRTHSLLTQKHNSSGERAGAICLFSCVYHLIQLIRSIFTSCT